MSGKSTGYEILKGKKPILLSAPHVFNHRRPSLSGVYKQGEPWTDYILKHICEEMGAYGIFSTQEIDYDPNYYKISKNEYKKEVRDLIKARKIKLFVDIHGLSDEHPYDFGIHFLRRYTKSKKFAYDLAKKLNRGKLRHSLIQVLFLNETKAESLSQYVTSELRVPSLQIEVSRYIREDEVLRESVIQNIRDFLDEINI